MPIHFSFLFKLFINHQYRSITLWPFIFIRDYDLKQDVILMNHEKIHLAQQKECLVIPFYVIYLTEYVIHRLKNQSHDKAYRNISFEREAYAKEKDFAYLSKRKHYANFRNSRI
jgi:hypothetical protein